MLDRDAIVGAFSGSRRSCGSGVPRVRSVSWAGRWMVLAFRARPSTKDVDAIFHPAALVRELARTVAAERELPSDWLNDGAKAFISERHETTDVDLPQFDGLRLMAPTAEYTK